jgi:ADP-ribose pyrophosphatase YjhB (NUDIX family)
MDVQNIGWAGQPEDIACVGPDGNFKLRAGAIVHDRDRILLCAVDDLDGWFLPGGKVAYGETAAAAAVRELREEMQLELTAGELRLVTEDMLTLNGTLHQEVCFYYEFAWPDGLSPDAAQDAVELAHSFRWVRRADLGGVDLLPPHLRAYLTEDPPGLRHLAFDRRGSDV